MKSDESFSENWLFVYGTLRRDAAGKPHVLLRGARFVAVGTFAGSRLYDLGAYPGVVRSDDPAEAVRGEVYALPVEEIAVAALDDLDRYEGCHPDDNPPPHEYRRELADIRLDTGENLRAWVYIYARPVEGLALIPSGDYRHRGRKDEG